MKLSDFLLGLHTGRDNATPDLGRVSWTVCTAAVLGHSVWQAAHTVNVDLVQLSGALVAVAGGHSLALWGKAKTEPGQ